MSGMTKALLTEIVERWGGVGPWTFLEEIHDNEVVRHSVRTLDGAPVAWTADNDATFDEKDARAISAAPDDVRDLLAEVARLTALLTPPADGNRYRKALEEIRDFDASVRRGCVDAWEQSWAFERCREIARDVLTPLPFDEAAWLSALDAVRLTVGGDSCDAELEAARSWADRVLYQHNDAGGELQIGFEHAGKLYWFCWVWPSGYAWTGAEGSELPAPLVKFLLNNFENRTSPAQKTT